MTKAQKIQMERQLRKSKKAARDIAADLGYSKEVIKLIDEAENEIRIEQILITARRAIA